MGAVHPHACGDNYSGADRVRECGGSPPRLWGQHYQIRHHEGILISKRPSKSTICLLATPDDRMENPCSELSEKIMTHDPFLDSLVSFSHRCSLTIPDRLPTKIPDLGSSIHFVSSPFRLTETFSRITTIIFILLRKFVKIVDATRWAIFKWIPEGAGNCGI